MDTGSDLEDLIDARLRERGSATFAAMAARIRRPEDENSSLKAMIGASAGTPVLVPDLGGSDDRLDIQ